MDILNELTLVADAYGTGEVTYVRNYYEKCIYPKLAAHQQVILVPGTFLSAPTGRLSTGAAANWTETDAVIRLLPCFVIIDESSFLTTNTFSGCGREARGVLFLGKE